MLDPKLLWVALPLLGYTAYALVSGFRQRLSRHLLNVHVSVLLLAYLCVTAGLGVFWVANQQLPVFDWHYLFGYATMLLVAAHLSFNLKIVVRALRKKHARTARSGTPVSKQAAVGGLLSRNGVSRLALFVVGMLGAFLLGMRHGANEFEITLGSSTADLSEGGRQQVIEQYHAFSSSSRSGVFARAAGTDWGPKPAAFKDYAGLASHSLFTEQVADLAGRPLSVALSGPASLRAEFRWQTLGALLFHTVGITARRSGWALRAAPSSGALFPTEVYVLVNRVGGIDPGLYHYAPQTERLQRLPSDGKPTLGLTLSGRPQAAPAVVVFTSVFRRTGHKYGDRAYRYAVADAGHAIENLRVAAHEAGLLATPSRSFDESVASSELGLDLHEEGVLALVPLSTEQRHPSPSPRRAFEPAPVDGPAAKSLGVTGWVQRATSLRFESPIERGERVPLPSAVHAPLPALEAIRTRRSQRRFSKRELTLVDLSSLLADTQATPPLLSNAVRINVVVNRVRGLDRGVYGYRADEHALTVVRRGDFAGRAQSVALAQEAIGRAAAVFVFSVDKSQLFHEGARGYRHAFLETGIWGERLLLSAVARNLGACPVGAFYDDEAAELIGVDAEKEWVLHFAAVGKL